MTNAASPGRGVASEFAGERSELRGHRSTPAKFCSSDIGCLVRQFFLRCPVGAQRAARNDQQNLAAFTILASLHARAKSERQRCRRTCSIGCCPPRRQMVLSTLELAAISATDDDERGFALWSGWRR